jgi:hypothetical protein
MFRVYPEPRRASLTRSLYPVYAEPRSDPRRARATLSAKPLPVPSSSDLCGLCASVSSSPDLCPFNFKLSTVNYVPNSHRITSFAYPHPLTPIESNLCKKQGEGVPTPLFDPLSDFNHCFVSNSHKIIFFAHPHPLTPTESYSCKKQGGGVPLSRAVRDGPHVFARHAGVLTTPILSWVYSITRGHRGVGTLLTTHYSLLTINLLKPPLQMAHPYTCTCKKGPAAREPRY